MPLGYSLICSSRRGLARAREVRKGQLVVSGRIGKSFVWLKNPEKGKGFRKIVQQAIQEKTQSNGLR
jgi:hypothetical protein